MTWDELRALWDERDDRYRSRMRTLTAAETEAETEAVRAYRWTEIALLPEGGRPHAVAALDVSTSARRWFA